MSMQACNEQVSHKIEVMGEVTSTKQAYKNKQNGKNMQKEKWIVEFLKNATKNFKTQCTVEKKKFLQFKNVENCHSRTKSHKTQS